MVERVIVSRFDCWEKCPRFTDAHFTSRALVDGILTVVSSFCIGLFGYGLYRTRIL